MMFESVRWGLPNLAVVVALAAMPLVSLAMPDQPPAAPAQFESAELDATPPIDVQIAFVE